MFRQYSSSVGRWMSPDPYNGSMDLGNPQTLNRYSYVSNSPLRYTDSSGLDPGSDIYTIAVYVFGAGGEFDPIQAILAGGLITLDAVGEALLAASLLIRSSRLPKRRDLTEDGASLTVAGQIRMPMTLPKITLLSNTD